MTAAFLVAVAAVAIVVRLWIRRSRRSQTARTPRTTPGATRQLDLRGAPLVASREIRVRLRGRPFRIGSAIILVAVALAIVLPVVLKGPTTPQHVGLVGTASPRLTATVQGTARRLGIEVDVTVVASATTARSELMKGRLDVVLLSDRALVVHSQLQTDDTSATAQLAEALAEVLGIQAAYRSAELSPAQIDRVDTATPVPILSLVSGTKNPNVGTSVIGVILVFLMLNQYNSWILLGVMEEKSSRVVEVLLATVRPLQLLAGKVLGIGLVALSQATVIVAFALGLAALVGSNLLHGTAPLEVASALLWLVLGYAFYCWVYAAAASMAERQDQVQSLVLPLSLPILLGYVLSLSVASTGNASLFFRVLAYLPPTAPFAMPVLVGLGQVTVWGFVASALISVACTIGVARIAGVVYRRAILRTGARVRLRDVVHTSR
jgi:ABC-2 type transport system permease protein